MPAWSHRHGQAPLPVISLYEKECLKKPLLLAVLVGEAHVRSKPVGFPDKGFPMVVSDEVEIGRHANPVFCGGAGRKDAYCG